MIGSISTMSFLCLIFLITLQCTVRISLGVDITLFGNDGGIPVPIQPDLPTISATADPCSTVTLLPQNTFPNTRMKYEFLTVPAARPDLTPNNKSWLLPIQEFTSKFIQSVNADSDLKNAFSLDGMDAAEVAEAYRDRIVEHHTDVESPETDFSSQLVYRAVKDNFHKATTDFHLKVVANFIANYLYFRGRITSGSVDDLVNTWVDELRKSVESYSNSDFSHQLSAENRIKAITRGIRNFLSSKGLYTADSVWALSGLFLNQWDS